MKVSTGKVSAAKADCSVLVTLAYEGTKPSGPLAGLDAASGGSFTRLWDRGEISTKQGKTQLFYDVTGINSPIVLVVGAGLESAFNEEAAFRAAGAAAKRLAERERKSVAFDFGKLPTPIAAAAVTGAMNGCVGQDIFRKDKNLKPIDEFVWLQTDEQALQTGQIVGEGMLLTRELVNLPPNYMYPESFAARAAQVAVSCGLEFEVWDELRLRRERCNALLAVNAGSSKPARLLIMRYKGKKKTAPLALVGKGVTFDSGGLSIKPTDGMITMKCDMAGAATVLGTLQTIARLGLDTPVVGLVGLVENMLSGNSFKLGDVLTARSGKTIEIHNTDAEGRLVLADVLNVALAENPSHIIDLATLTGACVVALGTEVTGLMGNDQQLATRLQAAAGEVGEYIWPLPMYPFFGEQIQSQVADIKNMGEGRWGGAITAAKFLEEFVDGRPWTHLDIAGPAFSEKPKPHLDAGGTGCMIRTLTRLAASM